MNLENSFTLPDVATEKVMGTNSANAPYPRKKLFTVRECFFQLPATLSRHSLDIFDPSPQLQKSVCNTNPPRYDLQKLKFPEPIKCTYRN